MLADSQDIIPVPLLLILAGDEAGSESGASSSVIDCLFQLTRNFMMGCCGISFEFSTT